MLTAYFTKFFTVLLQDERANRCALANALPRLPRSSRLMPPGSPALATTRIFVNIAAVAFGFNMCCVFYLAVYLPYIARITLEWNVYCPRVIPTVLFFSVICAIRCARAWPLASRAAHPLCSPFSSSCNDNCAPV